MPQELISFFGNALPGDLIFPAVVAGVWLLALLHTIFFRLKLAVMKVPRMSESAIPLSVIMIERNEEQNLVKNLPGWLSLGYPHYEVVVVDDFSGDNSISTLGVMKQQHPRLKMTGLNQETRFSQKLSRNLALKAAIYDRAVFAQPSMEMPHHQWLSSIASAFSRGKDMVVGYTATLPGKGLYHKMYRMESFFQQTESMACCINGIPWVATEDNIAFMREAYFEVNGFAGRMKEEYLNMEMIFNEVIRRRKTAVLPQGNLALRREMTAGKVEYLELVHKFFVLEKQLGFFKKGAMRFFNLLRMVLLPLFIACVILYPPFWLVFSVMLLLLFFLSAVSIKLIQKRLNEPGIFLSSLIYGFLAPWYRMVARWGFDFRRKNR